MFSQGSDERDVEFVPPRTVPGTGVANNRNYTKVWNDMRDIMIDGWERLRKQIQDRWRRLQDDAVESMERLQNFLSERTDKATDDRTKRYLRSMNDNLRNITDALKTFRDESRRQSPGDGRRGPAYKIEPRRQPK
ncbi:unnamed protein product [Oppiella nova]|uniref:Uncharacterized protein n=1 Tax=Oppiella nova TaxID=334625 RepID=A0A7R9LI66_9ACAR|nr:unnamed protein product [Oppiella nova]CAG2163909.1 unnamed protein product [Oppiella nova]